jgi:hypothetical protein
MLFQRNSQPRERELFQQMGTNSAVENVPSKQVLDLSTERTRIMKNLRNAAVIVAFAVASTAAHAGSVYVGNPLSSTGEADSSAPFVILGEYDASGPLASSSITLPTGIVQDVKFYGGNYDFTLYALSLVSGGPNPNEQTFKVTAAETFSGSASPGIQTLAVTGFSVSAGELLGFAGIGPFYPQVPNDALNSDAAYASGGSFFTATPPTLNQTLSVGLFGDSASTYTYINDFFGNQGRTYSIGVDVSTSAAGVPDSGSTLMMAGSVVATVGLIKRRRDLNR